MNKYTNNVLCRLEVIFTAKRHSIAFPIQYIHHNPSCIQHLGCMGCCISTAERFQISEHVIPGLVEAIPSLGGEGWSLITWPLLMIVTVKDLVVIIVLVVFGILVTCVELLYFELQILNILFLRTILWLVFCYSLTSSLVTCSYHFIHILIRCIDE